MAHDCKYTAISKCDYTDWKLDDRCRLTLRCKICGQFTEKVLKGNYRDWSVDEFNEESANAS